MTLSAFIAGLPKAELHVHIEGTLEPEMMLAFSRRNRIALAFKTVEEIRSAYRFTSLQGFLDLYYQGAAVLRTEEDFYDLTKAYLAKARADGVLHAEVFFDPQTHLSRGVPFSEVANGMLKAMADAEAELGLTTQLILCFLRHLTEEEAFQTLAAADPWLDRIAGVGLDSSELGHPPTKFAKVFAAAAALGLRRVAHAGEEGPPAYVEQALDILRVERIDHGNRALEDPRLSARLARTGVTLTVCPLSNLSLKVVPSLEAHPVAAMLEMGLRPCVNSDDPAYFGGYVNANYQAISACVGRQGLLALARNSFLGSFLSDEAVAAHLTALAAYDVASA
jgi:adenosine deaminase